MIKVNNLFDNRNMLKTESAGGYSVFEFQKDLSVSPETASDYFFMNQMGFRKRQLLCELNPQHTVKVQSGTMQWTAGNVTSETGLGSGVGVIGNLIKGKLKSMVTGESVIKPVYSGEGYLVLEPTFKYILIEDVGSWGPNGMVIDDGLFLACDTNLKDTVTMRTNLSSVFGGKGLFNTKLLGDGFAVLESSVPRDELIEINLENDTVKIDGNMAIAWSGSLKFTVERSSKSLIGSTINGEGLVNVYRGTGKILMAPVIPGALMDNGIPNQTKASKGPLSKLLK